MKLMPRLSSDFQINRRYFNYDYGEENPQRIYSGPGVERFDYRAVRDAVSERLRHMGMEWVKRYRHARKLYTQRRTLISRINDLSDPYFVARAQRRNYL